MFFPGGLWHRLSSGDYSLLTISKQDKQTGFVTAGFLLGATAGFLCSSACISKTVWKANLRHPSSLC
jgi:hypothetical protein